MKRIKRILGWLCRPVTQWLQVEDERDKIRQQKTFASDWIHNLIAILALPFVAILFFVVLVYLTIKGEPVCNDGDEPPVPPKA